MLGMHLHSPSTGVTGYIDAEKVTPDGKAIVRINDHWLDAHELVPAKEKAAA